jgi:hypothetical protein
MLIARERPERLGLSRMLNPQKFADTAGLTQFQPYDPARTPVVFVHGLRKPWRDRLCPCPDSAILCLHLRVCEATVDR